MKSTVNAPASATLIVLTPRVELSAAADVVVVKSCGNVVVTTTLVVSDVVIHVRTITTRLQHAACIHGAHNYCVSATTDFLQLNRVKFWEKINIISHDNDEK